MAEQSSRGIPMLADADAAKRADCKVKMYWSSWLWKWGAEVCKREII
jgi:hypothetical protein